MYVAENERRRGTITELGGKMNEGTREEGNRGMNK